jgi:Na+/phosphate symporter
MIRVSFFSHFINHSKETPMKQVGYCMGLRSLAGLLFAMLLASSVAAQGVTTAAFSGRVVDANGQAVYGANVIATHEPSGSVFGAVTRVDGRFNIPGMRVGGPY